MAFYNSFVPDTSGYSDVNANAVGSQYASIYNHAINDLLKRKFDELIWDAAPEQFMDLGLLFQKTPKIVGGDEHFWLEAPYDRIAIQAIAAVSASFEQVIPVAPDVIPYIASNMILSMTDNSGGIVKSVNPGNSTITVDAFTGAILPAVNIGDLFAVNSTIDPDGTTTIAPTYRLNTVTRFNYIQSISVKQRFGEVELLKYQMQGNTKNYLMEQKKRLAFQFKVSKSNAFWNGQRGEATSAENIPTKLMGGVDYFMSNYGSPSVSVSMANLSAAFEDLIFQTEYGAYGNRRFVFAPPRIINAVSLVYKRNLIRYAPKNDKIAQLELDEIDLGSTSVVFVPMKRFEDQASFPAAQNFKNRLYCLDLKAITPVINFGDRVGDTLNRNNGSLNRYTDNFMDGSMGGQFNNPKSHFKMTITGI